MGTHRHVHQLHDAAIGEMQPVSQMCRLPLVQLARVLLARLHDARSPCHCEVDRHRAVALSPALLTSGHIDLALVTPISRYGPCVWAWMVHAQHEPLYYICEYSVRVDPDCIGVFHIIGRFPLFISLMADFTM